MVLNVENHWMYLYAALSGKNKRYLKRYFSRIYPRNYVNRLVAAVENHNVQLKKSQFGGENRQ